MPAHVTLLYPFKPPDEIDGAALAGLRACFAGFASFRFTLAAIRRFEFGRSCIWSPSPPRRFAS